MTEAYEAIWKEILVSDIVIISRYRKDMGDISDLTKSIMDSPEGQIQNICVWELPAGHSLRKGGLYMLLAGERRVQSIKASNPLASIMSKIYPPETDEVTRKVIELNENDLRQSFSWSERIEIMYDIHALQVQKHGERTSTAAGTPGWSKKDTADKLNISPASVTMDLQLAEAMRDVPSLRDCKTKKDAYKLLWRAKRDVKREKVVKRFEDNEKTKGSITVVKALCDSYILMDFFEGVKKVPEKSVDLVEIDPPYAIDLHTHKDKAVALDYNEIAASEYTTFLDNVVRECMRVMKDNAWLIMWFGPDPWFHTVSCALKNHGLRFNMRPALWVKPNGQCTNPATNLASDYETFFYARKGVPEVQKPGRSSVFRFNPVPPSQKEHPTERPIELIEELLDTFSNPGEVVMVPFLGSGNTLFAAKNKSMKAFGYDLSSAYRDSFVLKAKMRYG